VHSKVKPFTERNATTLGAIGIGVTAGLVIAALQMGNLKFLASSGHDYSAYFAEASGLAPGVDVQVSGYPVGKVSAVDLRGAQVVVKFGVAGDIHLGDRTEAAVKTKSLLGVKVLELTPRGDGNLTGPIPQNRTTPAYELPDALGDLASTIGGLNTDQINSSLATLAKTFSDTPPSLRSAVTEVGRFSETLNARDTELRNLLKNANTSVGVLANRTGDIVKLITDTNALLAELRTQISALDQISHTLSRVARQLSGFIKENQSQLKPALEKLNGVLTIVDNRKDKVQEALKMLNQYAMSLGESVSSGPFFNAYLANLLPGQFLQPFVESAFSDLGLDPNVLPPSKLNDPTTGQPATPPLPMPYPRTGQGGPPAQNLPDAITGKPGDPRYPYREPLPAPPPGGPPPGPPARSPNASQQPDYRPQLGIGESGPASSPGPATPRPPGGAQ
jgi:phospholipid/cholesterol/gamma-HCH transport system substrate-binding protein